MTTDKEKAELTVSTFETFFEQFGRDKHAEIILDCLIKVLLDAETIRILDKSEQEGNQVDNNPDD